MILIFHYFAVNYSILFNCKRFHANSFNKSAILFELKFIFFLYSALLGVKYVFCVLSGHLLLLTNRRLTPTELSGTFINIPFPTIKMMSQQQQPYRHQQHWSKCSPTGRARRAEIKWKFLLLANIFGQEKNDKFSVSLFEIK